MMIWQMSISSSPSRVPSTIQRLACTIQCLHLLQSIAWMDKLQEIHKQFARSKLSPCRMRSMAASVPRTSLTPALILRLCLFDNVPMVPFSDSRLKSTGINDATKHTVSLTFRGGCKKLNARATPSSLLNLVVRRHDSRSSRSSHVSDPSRRISVVLYQYATSSGIPILVSIGLIFTFTLTHFSVGILSPGGSLGFEIPALP